MSGQRLPWGVTLVPWTKAVDHPVLIGQGESALAFEFGPKLFKLLLVPSNQLLQLFWRHCSVPDNNGELTKRTAKKKNGCQGFHCGHLGGRLRR